MFSDEREWKCWGYEEYGIDDDDDDDDDNDDRRTVYLLDVPVYAGHVDKKNFGSCWQKKRVKTRAGFHTRVKTRIYVWKPARL